MGFFSFFRRKERNINYYQESKNIAASINGAKKLYSELIVKVHPDKVVEDKRDLANSFSQRINSSRYNYFELLNLKEEVEKYFD